MSAESEKEFKIENHGKFNLPEINSSDPEILDLTASVSEQAENLIQSLDASPKARSFVKVLTAENGNETILSSLEKLSGNEDGYDGFVKLVTDIIELQRLREQRRMELVDIMSQLSNPDLSEADKEKLENLKREYTRELREDLINAINRLAKRLFATYPELAAKLALND